MCADQKILAPRRAKGKNSLLKLDTLERIVLCVPRQVLEALEAQKFFFNSSTLVWLVWLDRKNFLWNILRVNETYTRSLVSLVW